MIQDACGNTGLMHIGMPQGPTAVLEQIGQIVADSFPAVRRQFIAEARNENDTRIELLFLVDSDPPLTFEVFEGLKARIEESARQVLPPEIPLRFLAISEGDLFWESAEEELITPFYTRP